jgi:hypothetical protein
MFRSNGQILQQLTSSEAIDVATQLMNLATQAAGLAANMQSARGTAAPIRNNNYGQGAPANPRYYSNQSTITGGR